MDPEYEYLAAKAGLAFSFLQEPGNESAWRELRQITEMDADELGQWVTQDPRSFLRLAPVSRLAHIEANPAHQPEQQIVIPNEKAFDRSLLPEVGWAPFSHNFSQEALQRVPTELKYIRATVNRALICCLRDFAYPNLVWLAFEYIVSKSSGPAAGFFVFGQGLCNLCILISLVVLGIHLWYRRTVFRSFKSAPKSLDGEVSWSWDNVNTEVFPPTWSR